MSAYRGPDTGLDAKDTAVSEIVASPVLREQRSRWEETDRKVRRQTGQSADGPDETHKIRRSSEISTAHPLSPSPSPTPLGGSLHRSGRSAEQGVQVPAVR